MKVKFTVKFLKGLTTVAVVEGREMNIASMNVADVTNRVVETEQYLERLTGLRVHIEQVG